MKNQTILAKLNINITNINKYNFFYIFESVIMLVTISNVIGTVVF